MREILPTGDMGFDDPVALSAYPEDSQKLVGAPLLNKRVLRELAENWCETYDGESDRMSVEQEQQLSQLIQEGLAAETYLATKQRISAQKRESLDQAIEAGKQAQQALVETNLRFAMYYARVSMGIDQSTSYERFMAARGDFESRERQRYIGTYSPLASLKTPNQELEDRYSMAFMGLVEAARKYKPTTTKNGRHPKFTSYAAWSIQQQLQRGIAASEHTGARLPDGPWQRLRQYFHEYQSVDEGHRVPEDIQMLIDLTSSNPMPEVGVPAHGSPEELRDEWGEDDTPTSFAEVWDDWNIRDELYMSLARKALVMVLNSLSEREKTTIADRFGMVDGAEQTLDEIGKLFGVTRERIRQIESKSMSKIRHPSRSDHLAGLLDLIIGADSEYPTIRRGDSSALRTPDRWESGSVFAKEQSLETHELDPNSEGAILKQEQETWQAFPGEAWELPERIGKTLSDERFEDALDAIEKAAPFMYTNRYVEQAKTPYPVLTMEKLREIIGDASLSGDQISTLWDTYMSTTYLKLQEELGDTFNSGRVGQLFSQIIEEFATIDTEMITLAIPEEEFGKINNLASRLSKGIVKIAGNPGDFVAANNSGYSSVYVEGSCGDGAGLHMKGHASLYVVGTVGKLSGMTDSTTTEIIVEGQDI